MRDGARRAMTPIVCADTRTAVDVPIPLFDSSRDEINMVTLKYQIFPCRPQKL